MNTALPPMPIIVGAPRSGTTLLRFMLDAHPVLAIPPETGFLAIGTSFEGTGDRLRERFFETITTYPADAPVWADFGIATSDLWSSLETIAPFTAGDGYRAFYRLYARRQGKARWGDKTPMYCLHLPAIEEVLPEAHFIHVIRDGRDVALSLREMWFSPGRDLEVLAGHWATCVTTARQQGTRCRHYLEVRFEDLVRDASTVLQTICRFVELPYAGEMLDYHHHAFDRLREHGDRRRSDGSQIVSHADRLRQQALTMRPPQQSRAQAWRGRLDAAERSRFEAIAGLLLRELGYADPVDAAT